MGLVVIETLIRAPAQRAFDASRDIGLHTETQAHAGERAVAGVTTGLIGMDEEVTFEARHFGLRLQHTARITAFEPPRRFVDSMTRGAFKSFVHEHLFEEGSEGTLMTDRIELRAPLGPIGRLAEWLFLDRYIERLQRDRARQIKDHCESEVAG